MAYTQPSTQATGDLVSASLWNTVIKDNWIALWQYTTAGDIVYATGASTLARLAAGAANTLLYSTGSAPAYATLASVTAATPLVGSQAAGDVFISSSDNVTSRLGIGTQFQVLMAGSQVPAYSSVIYRRKGGSATHWNTGGTTTYTPTAPKIQVGSVSVAVNTTGTASVTYPVAFTNNPAVLLSPEGAFGNCTVMKEGEGTSGFSIRIKDFDTSGAITVVIAWLAIGE